MTTREKLAEAVLAAAGLPEEAQELIAEEVLARVSDLSQSQLTMVQRREIKRRLAQPRVHVPDQEVRALFQHYNPAL
jgi:ABC-type nitrate/sulfonate/bicarbonate transport system substrate-binding protein